VPAPNTCQQQQQQYAMFRQQLVDKYSGTPGCETNADCTVFYDKGTCGSSCAIVLPRSLVENLSSNLRAYAETTCNVQCPSPPVPPCDPVEAVCWKGYCE
jgi:hypothetical protein